MIKWMINTLMVLSVIACSSNPDIFVPPPEPGDNLYAPPEVEYNVYKQSKGTLYTGYSSLNLFQDMKAYRVGDILTVLLEEKTESDKQATTAFGKSTSFDLDSPQIGNQVFDDFSANLNGSRDFDGSSASSQGNSLSGSITVTVYEILPNGILKVRGEKWLKLNQGDEFIRLTGNVRVEDISKDNEISSLRIADARITYAGRGDFANTNKPGWLTRFFNSAWFPF